MYMLKKKRILKFSQSINEALFLSMKKDKNVLLMGLGVDDPKGIFSTTLNSTSFAATAHKPLSFSSAFFMKSSDDFM